MTYHNAIKYILTSPQRNGASGTGADSFERVRLICARLGSPEKRLKYIRFAGSNGKTVCQTMLESVLHAAGIKVGSLLMPVSAEPRENVRIGRVPLAMEEVVRYVSAIVAAVNELKSEETEKDESSNGKKTDLDLTPTKNEMIFLVALLAFRDADCDICLIECEHNSADPTKMLAPPYAAIICGAIPAENTREANKIRSYLLGGMTEVVSAPQDPDTYKIISSACARVNCRLSVPTRSMLSIERMTLGGSEFVYRGERYSLSLPGRFQINNATTVIEAVRMLNRSGADISADALRRGLAGVSIKSKFEALSVLPTIISDSTHKTEAVEAMCETLADFKVQTGNVMKLCIPADAQLIKAYLEKLASLGYEVTELIIPYFEKNAPAPSIDFDGKITVCQTAKACAKHVVSASREGGFTLLTAPITVGEKLRDEIIKILQF